MVHRKMTASRHRHSVATLQKANRLRAMKAARAADKEVKKSRVRFFKGVLAELKSTQKSLLRNLAKTKSPVDRASIEKSLDYLNQKISHTMREMRA